MFKYLVLIAIAKFVRFIHSSYKSHFSLILLQQWHKLFKVRLK